MLQFASTFRQFSPANKVELSLFTFRMKFPWRRTKMISVQARTANTVRHARVYGRCAVIFYTSIVCFCLIGFNFMRLLVLFRYVSRVVYNLLYMKIVSALQSQSETFLEVYWLSLYQSSSGPKPFLQCNRLWLGYEWQVHKAQPLY